MHFVFGILLLFGMIPGGLGRCSTSPLSFKNGQSNMTTIAIVSSGDVVNFTCHQGYTIVGMSVIRCNQDGTWSHPPPSCKAVNCGDISNVANGEFVREDGTAFDSKFGAKVSVKCVNNTILNGSAILTCSDNGSWGSKPMCVESECGDHPGLNSACTKRTELLQNGSLVYHCKNSTANFAVTKIGNGLITCYDRWIPAESGCFCDELYLRPNLKRNVLFVCLVALSCVLSLFIYHAIDNRDKIIATLFCKPFEKRRLEKERVEN